MKSLETLELLVLTATKTHISINALQLKMCKSKKKKNHQAFKTPSFFFTMIALNFHSLHFYVFATIVNLPCVVLIFLALELFTMKLHH